MRRQFKYLRFGPAIAAGEAMHIQRQLLRLTLQSVQQRTFQIHVGSTAWYDALKRDGMRVDVAPFLKNWSERAAVYQQQVKKYWLYP